MDTEFNEPKKILEQNTCSWREPWENVWERVTIVPGLYFWLDEKVVWIFLSQSCRVEIQIPITLRRSGENPSIPIYT